MQGSAQNDRERSEKREKPRKKRDCCEEDRYQTDLLIGLIKRLDLANCHLEQIARNTCLAVNELHVQTALQTSMAGGLNRLLALAEMKEPGLVAQLDEFERLRRQIAECCHEDDEEEPPVCECHPCGDRDEDKPGKREAIPGVAYPGRVEDAPYKPADRDGKPGKPANDRPVRKVPDGPFKGMLREMPSFAPEGADTPGSGIDFNPWTSLPGVTPASVNAADISGGDAGQVVMITGNWYASYSTDGGQTFTTIDPTTVFPNTLAGGFCCDQIIQYVPSIDRFVWLLQYSSTTAGDNAYRLAAASPQDIIDSNCTRWTYWDFTSGTFGLGTDWMDYPSMAVGDNSIYFSFDVLDTTTDSLADNGLVVARLPLSAIQTAATINFWFTSPADGPLAWGSHVSQDTGDEAFWAGHIDNSTMRVFSWHEDSTTYFWRSVDVANWPNSTRSSLGPNSNNWFGWAFPGNACMGATRQGDIIWFAWMASDGDGGNGGFDFPHPHVQVAQIRVGTYELVRQMTIWNPDFAFGYPCFATNSDGEVGVAVGWGGGGSLNANSAVGFMGDYVVYFRDDSTWTHTRWGDYISVRRAAPDPKVFAGFGYVILADATTTEGYRFEPYFVRFSRETITPPPIG